MAIMIDKRLEKFVEATVINDVFSIHLKDINESFHFDSEKDVQDFLNRQTTERFGKDELKNWYFDYEDVEYHRFQIGGVVRGKITSYIEVILCKHSKESLYDEYGYLMNKEHGKDAELLLNIMRCNGIDVQEKDGFYLTLAD